MNNIDLNLFKTFYFVALHNSFTKASEKLYISQPAVTQSIKKLEEQLNVELFKRTSNGIVLTKEGEKVFYYAEQLNNLIEANSNLINKIKEDENNIYLGGNGGSYIKEYLPVDEIKELIAYTDKVYLDFGAETKLEGIEHREEIKELQEKAKKEGLSLIDIPIRHLGTEKAHELYYRIEKHLENNGVDMLFETSVTDLIIKDNIIKGIKIKKSKDLENIEIQDEEILADKVILGVGRKGASWLTAMCEKHNIETTSGCVDIGVRYELPDSVMKDINTFMEELSKLLKKN